jgi:ABC-type bacteriocin/lantibiotic exporter with double-glycine peptidase domain
MTEPIVIQPSINKMGSDCAIACVEMLTGLPYQTVRDAVPRRYLKDLNNGAGLSNRQLRNLAARLGFSLRYVKWDDVTSTMVGILDLQRLADPANPKGEWEGHFLIFSKFTLYNPADGTIWTDPDAFFKTRRWEPLGVFVREA